MNNEERLRQIASQLLKNAPAGALSAPMVQSLQAPTLSAFHSAGRALLAGGHRDAAETIFRALVDWPGIDAWVFSGLAQVASARGHWEEAVKAWQTCFDKFPDRLEPWWFLELARVQRERGRQLEAEALLRQCRAKFPAFGPAAAVLADLLGKLGRHEECYAAWQSAMREFAESAEPWWFETLARVERERGRAAEAETLLRQCRAKLPTYGPAAATLADLLGTLGRHEECRAAWQTAMREFAESAEPWWFEAGARAERDCGHPAEAETLLRQCRAKFPTYGPAAATLADLLGTLGRHEETVAIWQAATLEFSEAVQPWWFLSFADSLRALGLHKQAERVLDDMDARFPDLPQTLVHRAEIAANCEDWATALDRWTACIERHQHQTRPEWLNGRALALFRLWRMEEASGGWNDLTGRFPDFVPGRIYLAEAARELGLWETTRQCYTELISRFPDRATPDWFAGQARGLLYGRFEQAARRAIDELDEKFPGSPLACNLRVEFYYYMQAGLDQILPQIEAAQHRFPNDPSLLAEQVRALLASGRPEEAEAVATHLETLGSNHHALLSRWRVVMDRSGEDAVRDSARHALNGRDWAPESGLAIGEFLLSLSSAWAIELAHELFHNLAAKFPGRAAIVCAQANALIALGRDDLALGFIDLLPAAYRTREVLELKAWAASRRGEHVLAQDLWRTILTRNYFPALHSAEPKLELLTPDRDALPPKGVTAFLLVRNEIAHLAEFLRHHRQLGVGRFVVVDNLSTDGSADYLCSQPDVILYQTPDAFQTSSSGMRWINLLRDRYGNGGWCLHADADEAFIYPGWETTPLSRLTAYLDTEGAEGMAAFMLDVYPRRLLDEEGKPATWADCRYYDADYVWIGQVRAPYIRPLGGVRWRLFGVHEILHKVPLLRHGHHIDSHCTIPLQFAKITAVLLHYKLLNLALGYRAPGSWAGGNPYRVDRSPDLMRRHVRYAAGMPWLLKSDLIRPKRSEALTDSLVLADRGLMQAPAEFRRWLEAQGSAYNPTASDK